MENIIIYGDSIGKGIIYNEERARYALTKGRFEKLLADEMAFDNRAFMGATLPQGLAEFKEADLPEGAMIAIEYGGNDCDMDWQAVSDAPDIPHEARTPLDAFERGLREFVALARARKLRPLLVSTVPLHARRYYDWVSRGKSAENILRYLGDAEHIARWQERYATRVYRVAYQTDCPLFDLRAAFLARRDFPQLMCVDGIHPNDEGQKVIAEAIRRFRNQ